MSFNKFFFAATLMVVFGVNSNGVTGDPDDIPIRFPEGFFCDLICEKWGVLTGNTVMCFISNQGEYLRFVARNSAFGMWRFYKVDLSSQVNSICQEAVTGDEFFLNDTDIQCPPPLLQSKRFFSRGVKNLRYRFDDFTPSRRSDIDVRVPMHAICELATTQLCRHGRIIDCSQGDTCCWAKSNGGTCEEDTMSLFNDCYKVLHNVITNMV